MYCQKLLGWTPWADSMGLAAVILMKLAPKAAVMREVARNNGQGATQGHSRSPILVPIESTYV